MSIEIKQARAEHITRLVDAIEKIRAQRQRERRRSDKTFSQEELRIVAYPSYKNLLTGRTLRLPDRSVLLQIAEYLECTPAEHQTLLRIAGYLPEVTHDVQQRRLVVAMVCRMSHTSALIHMLDFEEVAQVTQSLWERLAAVAADYGAIIHKGAGDELLALWGVDVTHEGDPERAIRAALSMQTVAYDAQGAALHIGVHVGMALLHMRGATGELTATGEAVSVAAQLERAALPRTICLSAQIYRHVRDLFDVQPVNTTDLPFGVYRVERISPYQVPAWVLDAPDSRFIGRAVELDQLQANLRMVSKIGAFHTTLITGDIGVGKSRLLYEFNRRLESQSRAYCLWGRATLSDRDTPYALFRSIIACHCRITEGDSAEVMRQKLHAGLSDHRVDGSGMNTFEHLFGLGAEPNVQIDSKHLHDCLANDFRRFFHHLAARASVALLVENLHWADARSLELLNTLMKALGRCPLLLVATTRRALPGWAESIELKPLSNAHSYALLESIIPHIHDLPTTLRECVLSSGSPLYITELAHTLQERGTLARPCSGATEASLLHIPTTLFTLLQTRLDRLSDEEQRVLHAAAVIGRVFWSRAVHFVCGGDGKPAATARVLDTLQEQGFIVRRPMAMARFSGCVEYAFQPAVLRDVVYDTILKRDRSVYHERAAQWLMQETERAGIVDVRGDDGRPWYGYVDRAKRARCWGWGNATCA
jgi:class 3 adenylate cyclase